MKQGATPIYRRVFAVAAFAAFFVISIGGANAATHSTVSATHSTVSLSLGVTGVGGAVTTKPSGFVRSCAGSRCVYSFDANTAVTLTATAAKPPSRFARWLGACAGPQSSCSILLTESKTVTARFSPVRLYIQPTPREGDVDVRTPGTPCGTGCSQFEYGTTVEIGARECCGFRFDSWSGKCSGQGSTCRFPIFDLAETTPRFRCDGSDCVGTNASPLSRDVKATLYVYGHGTAAINGAKCVGPKLCKFTFERNKAVVVRAYNSSTFDRWGGTVCSGSSPRCQFQAFSTPYGKPQQITAKFRS
jgi:Divergent InlB B-repeat domain